jgi:hypothetical protein
VKRSHCASIVVLLLFIVACAPATPPPTPTADIAATTTAQSILDLCNAETLPSGKISSTKNKFIALESDGNSHGDTNFDSYSLELSSDYHKAFSADQQGTLSNATALACINHKRTVIENCRYTTSSGPDKDEPYFVTRYKQDIVIRMIDIASKTLVATTTLEGAQPKDCSNSVSSDALDTEINGDEPAPKAFLAWVNSATQ